MQISGNVSSTGVTGGIHLDGAGSTVVIEPVLTTGVKIADYSIDDIPGALYCLPAQEVDVHPEAITGQLICTIEIDGAPYYIYAPDPGDTISYTNNISDNDKTKIGDLVINGNNTPVYMPTVHYVDLMGGTGINIGGLQVGDGIIPIYAPAASGGGIDYSITEQDTGLKWIDGRSIYQITCNVSLSSSQTNVDLSAYDIDNIMEISGFSVHSNNSYCLSFPYYENNNYSTCWNYEKSTGHLQIYAGSGIQSSYSNTYITLKYVKVVTP